MPALLRRPGGAVGGDGDRVGGEDQARVLQTLDCGPHPVRDRRDEQRVVVEVAQLDEVRRRAGALDRRVAGPRDVLVVLPAGGVAPVGAGREHEGPAHPVLRHLRHGVLGVRVPVAVAEVDRQLTARLPQRARQVGHVAPVELVDRADAAEVLVVLLDGVEAFRGHVAAAGHVLEERPHLVGRLRASEGQDQDGVVGSAHAVQHPPRSWRRHVHPERAHWAVRLTPVAPARDHGSLSVATRREGAGWTTGWTGRSSNCGCTA